jgi:hypothetical protein
LINAVICEESFQSDERSAVVAVPDAIADLKNVDTTELPTLQESVNPDVLNKIVNGSDAGPDSAAGVWFSYAGFVVFVRGDETILISDPDQHPEDTPFW